MDAGKLHLLQRLPIFPDEMVPPGRPGLDVHDVEHVDKHEGLLRGVIERPIRVLFKEFPAGGIDSAVGDGAHAQFLRLPDFSQNGGAGDFFSHHVPVVFAVGHEGIVTVGPVVKLDHVDVAFPQPVHCPIVRVLGGKVAYKAVSQGAFWAVCHVERRFQNGGSAAARQPHAHPVARERAVEAAQPKKGAPPLRAQALPQDKVV